MNNMNTIKESLSVFGSQPTVPVKPTFDLDPLNLRGQVSLRKLNYTEYASLPIMISNLTVTPPDEGAVIAFHSVDYGVFRDHNPHLRSLYQWHRYTAKYIIEVTSHWQQTGLLCAYWSPANGATQRYLLRTNSEKDRVLQGWFTPDERKTYIRVGHTSVHELAVPWIHPYPAYKSYRVSSGTTPSHLRSAYAGPTLRIVNLTPIRSKANTTTTISIKLWLQYTDVEVGGYTGIIREPFTLVNASNNDELSESE